MSNVRPSGAGLFNTNLNTLLLDPNRDTVMAGKNLFVVQNPDINLSEVTTYQVLLVEYVTTDYSWWIYEYDVVTKIWTNIDNDTAYSLSQITTKLGAFFLNSMNVPVSDAEVTTIKAMLGIV